jgi:hypothetical protein
MQPFELNPNRVDKAQQVIGQLATRLTDPEIMALMITSELNMYDRVKYDENGLLTWDMTDLQLVAFAAAIAAVSEIGGYLSPTPLVRNRIQIGRVELQENVNA